MTKMCFACGREIDMHEETHLRKCLIELSKNNYRDCEIDLP